MIFQHQLKKDCRIFGEDSLFQYAYYTILVLLDKSIFGIEIFILILFLRIKKIYLKPKLLISKNFTIIDFYNSTDVTRSLQDNIRFVEVFTFSEILELLLNRTNIKKYNLFLHKLTFSFINFKMCTKRCQRSQLYFNFL